MQENKHALNARLQRIMKYSYPYTLGVVSFLKSSQELRVTLMVKFTILSSGTPSHEPSKRGIALRMEKRKKEGRRE